MLMILIDITEILMLDIVKIFNKIVNVKGHMSQEKYCIYKIISPHFLELNNNRL